MGLKKYVAFSLVLIVAVYVFAFSIESGNYTLKVLDYSFELPIAIWLILPISVLFLLTVLHIVFYGFKSYLQTNSMKKDEENILEYFKELVLENNSNKKFKQKSLKELSEILSQLTFEPKNDDFKSTNKDIESIVNAIIKIRNGEYVSDKSLKFNKNGEIYQKNLENRVSKDVDYAIDVLKKADTYASSVVKVAFKNVVENKSMTTIKKLLDGLKLDKEMLFILIEKDSQNSEFALEQEILVKYIKNANFDKDDFIKLASFYKKSSTPDNLIKLFEILSTDNELALDSYLIVLFEYEMIDKIREILTSVNENEYQAFKALLELKDSGKNYTLESISYK